MFTTARLVIATTSMTLAIAMPWPTNTAQAGGKQVPAEVAQASDREVPAGVEVGPSAAPIDAPQPAKADTPKADAQDADAGEAKPNKPSSAHLLADPKPLSDAVKKGLQWLADQQLDNGGWGQGEESANMRGNAKEKAKLADTANVGDTCAAALTLLREGSTPNSGTYDVNLRKAVGYVCESIEAADEKDLYVTTVRNTRLQAKLGTYVDTFLAAQLLSEVKDNMASDKANARVDACLDKVIKKIESHQNDKGQFGGRGWAMALNDAIAGKALNRAAQAGADVDPEAIEKSRENAKALSAPAGAEGKFGAAEGTAGIELYGAANSVGGQREADTTYRQQIEQQREEVRKVLEQAKEQAGEDEEGQAIKDNADKALKQLADAGDEVKASEEIASTVAELSAQLRDSKAFDMDEDKLENLDGFALSNTNWAGNKKNLDVAQDAITRRLDDERFVAGFGNNGGEEFLSYTRIGESLYLEGGEAWDKFDKKMTENLTNVQNKDGSWSGHHCITGRSFCTATALSVLMTDRMHVPEELLEKARAEHAQAVEQIKEAQPEGAEKAK